MLIWLSIALLSGCAVLGLLWPLAKPTSERHGRDDRDFYLGQLADIERDKSRGLLDEVTAEDAKTEAARRLLAVVRDDDVGVDPARRVRRRKLASLIALVCVPVLAFTLYGQLGSPNLPDQPISSRSSNLGENPDLSMMIAKVEARLADHPEDGMGWGTIAPIYLSLGRYDDAIKAFANALKILGESADLRSGLGEARMASADGIVTAEALVDFNMALADDPTNERGQYYRALAAEQDGDKSRALVLYQTLYASLSPNSDAARLVSKHLAALSGIQGKSAIDPNGPQSDMIKAMVARLDARLATDGSDLEGWVKLLRAYQVLGDGAKVKAVFARAKAAMSANPDGLARLNAAAQDLGLSNEPGISN